MNVPPFIPPQIEIAGNVAQQPYLTRIAFVKRVVSLHTAFVALILGVALMPWPSVARESAVLLNLGSLLGLSLVRGVAKGWRHEQLLSSICVPALVAGVALLIRNMTETGVPFWAFGIAPLAMLGYSVSCGRDLSFVGMFMIGTIVALLALAGGCAFLHLSIPMALEIVLPLIAYMLYFVYDLAALQTRRRRGEELGAVLDLFRDLLNFTTYPIRVINHWRRHRIWSLRG